MFEASKWIDGHAKRIINVDEIEHGSYLFRKAVDITSPVQEATLHGVGLGYGIFYVNGQKVTDHVLTTPFTRFDSRVLYLTYDVTELLTDGKNALCAFVGNGWYNDVGRVWNLEKATWRHYPKLILQLDILYKDGSKQTIVTDSSWKTDKGAAVYNHMRDGEIYDARLEQPGWNLPEFDDSHWSSVKICRGAGGILQPADLPPIRVIRTLTPTYLGNGVYDFGENTSGWVKIKSSGKRGTEISMHYSELLNQENDIDNAQLRRFTLNDLQQCDKYILKGEGVEEWEPNFVYHGFRYVKVENAPENFEIQAQVVHTDLEIIGEFECSDQMLNQIHQATRRSTLTNYHGIPTDCPHREQLGWTGDALVSTEQSLMNYDMIKAYKKWLIDFKDVQRPNGQIPGIIPTSNWGYNWGSGPAWDSALILIPWQVYQITGDSSIISTMWENMKLYMKFMDSMAENYLVDYGLADWCPPDGAVTCPSIVTDTAYYYINAKTMCLCAEIMNEDGSEYANLAEKIKAAYRDKFLNDPHLETSQTFLACGIYQGLYNADEAPQKAELLATLVKNNDYHIDCGILGTKYIFTALSEYGYAPVLYKMVTNPTAPSYAYWINKGMTTLCETWSMNRSCNHHMFSEVDMWFYKHVAGIKITNGRLVIEPCMIEELEWVKAKHKDIEVCYDDTHLTVNVPQKAEVVINGQTHVVEMGTHTFPRR